MSGVFLLLLPHSLSISVPVIVWGSEFCEHSVVNKPLFFSCFLGFFGFFFSWWRKITETFRGDYSLQCLLNLSQNWDNELMKFHFNNHSLNSTNSTNLSRPLCKASCPSGESTPPPRLPVWDCQQTHLLSPPASRSLINRLNRTLPGTASWQTSLVTGRLPGIT